MSDMTDNQNEGRKPYDLFGTQFGRYHVGKELGQGGYARVYRAVEPEIEREVALKILLPGDGGSYSAKLRKRFLREAKLVARLKDHHSIKLFDYGEEEGLLYLAFEYVEGETLGERLGREGPLKPFMVAKMLEQLLDSLKEAHDMGILHRDIKPGNVMLYEHERRGVEIKVLDFGIGKFVREQKKYTQLTAEGRMIGTPRYMSPEQMRGSQDLGPGCDLWAVGMVAYECLVGSPAIETDDAMAMTTRILDDRPFELPQEIEAPKFMRDMVHKLLRKDPARRYQNAGQVLEDLEEFKTRATVELQEGALRERFEEASGAGDLIKEKGAQVEEDVEDATPGERPSARKKKEPAPETEQEKGSKWKDRDVVKKVVLAAGAAVVCLVVVLVIASDNEPSDEVPSFLEEHEATAVEDQEDVPAAVEEEQRDAGPVAKEPRKKSTAEVPSALEQREKDELRKPEATRKSPTKPKTVDKAASSAKRVEKSKPSPVASEEKEEKAATKRRSAEPLVEADNRKQASEETSSDDEEVAEAAADEKPAEDSDKNDDTKLRVWGVE